MKIDVAARTDLVPSRGTYAGKQVMIWNDVRNCEHDCPLRDKCTVVKIDAPCSVQVRFTQHIVDVVMSTTASKMTELQLMQFGTQIMPLYATLIRLKILEASLPSGGMLYESKSGLKMHPVYKEIRDTIKTLIAAWRDLGLVPILIAKNFDGDDNSVYELMGDPDYYDSLSVDEGEEEEQKPKKRKRK